MDDGASFADLIRRARAGDAAATSALLGQFEHDVRTMVRVRLPRVLRNQFDSMDFVQAVWASVLTNKADREEPDAFADEGKFRGFLAGVARNKVYEEHRRQTRTKKYDLGREERLYVRKGDRDVPLEVQASDPTPSENVQAGECLDQLIEGGSEREALVIALRRDGSTYAEIAARIGLTERSVRRAIDAIWERREARRWR